MKINSLFLVCLLNLFLVISCTTSGDQATNQTSSEGTHQSDYDLPRVPDWHKNACIYEVNLRQFSEEGTFKAFESHIPRLQKMGIDILWFMPIHPVSKEKRKGTLGSPYAVGDYYDVNPLFGTMKDFKNMLAAIHDAGMYCIIDWVPNHTGWDNPWITAHPDWYTKGKDGNITDPINPTTGESWGWTDVADLNYDNADMRKGMIDAMSFWIEDVGIDGFRVDVAHGVPADFWDEAAEALYAIEPIFMLAESEIPALVNSGAFIMDYGWEIHHLFNEIAQSQGIGVAAKKLEQGNVVDGEAEKEAKKTALDIDKMLAEKAKQYSKGYQMQFTSNHDENSWAGTVKDRFGEGHKTFAVLAATFNGMPLLYSGMESAMDKQLEFFEKDAIEWEDYPYADFYTALFELKGDNKALWNGEHGGALNKITTGNDENIYAFSREKDGDKVVVILNLSAANQTFKLNGSHVGGDYENVFTNEKTSLSDGQSMKLNAWEYIVLES